MPFSKINITLTPAQVQAIQKAINELKNPANMPVQFNLTKKERTSLPNISNERYPYVQRSVQIHGPNNPGFVSGDAGTQAEATNDLTYYDQVENFIQQLTQALEIYTDTQQVAGSEAFVWMRNLYGTAQLKAANQVPGADTVVDDLKPLFDKENTGDVPPVT